MPSLNDAVQVYPFMLWQQYSQFSSSAVQSMAASAGFTASMDTKTVAITHRAMITCNFAIVFLVMMFVIDGLKIQL